MEYRTPWLVAQEWPVLVSRKSATTVPEYPRSDSNEAVSHTSGQYLVTCSLRHTLKRGAEPLLGSLAWHTRREQYRRGCVILAYHNVRPTNEVASGERALHIPWGRFCEHLDTLQELAEVVSLPEALHAGAASERPRVVLTFDDAYSGAVRLALPELARRRLPGTMFVAPQLLGGRSFWWDQLAEHFDGTLSTEVRGMALTRCSGEQDRVRSWAKLTGLRWSDAMPDWATGASLEDLKAAAQLPRIELGSHSWSHANLTALDGDALAREMTLSKAWLRDHSFGETPSLAFPYGLADNPSIGAAQAAGYECGLLVSGGFLRSTSGALSLPRLNIPAGLSSAGLKLRLSGWMAH